MPRRTALLATLAVGLAMACAPEPAKAPRLAPAAPPSRAAPLFEFHSDPWVNAHQQLLAEVQVNDWWHGPVAPCACAQTPAWQAALDVYRAKLKGNTGADGKLAEMNFALALAGREGTPVAADLLPEAVGVLPAAVDAYEKSTWPADDARNQAWIAAVQPLLSRWGESIASEFGKRFETSWPSSPVRVEVTHYASFAGAFTEDRPIILTTMSSEDAGYQGEGALEMLFHESSHALATALSHDLQSAFLRRGKRAPSDLYHVLIFYTAGELVRKRLGPAYVPYGIKQHVYRRGWEKLEPAVRVHWQAWLDDVVDLPTALDRLAQAL